MIRLAVAERNPRGRLEVRLTFAAEHLDHDERSDKKIERCAHVRLRLSNAPLSDLNLLAFGNQQLTVRELKEAALT